MKTQLILGVALSAALAVSTVALADPPSHTMAVHDQKARDHMVKADHQKARDRDHAAAVDRKKARDRDHMAAADRQNARDRDHAAAVDRARDKDAHH